MAKESKSTIIVATISAVSAIIVAVITTFSTIAISKPEVQRVKKKLEDVNDLKIVNLPVGSIVASLLSPSVFAEEVGDPSVFDPKESRWTLAAGEEGEDITISKYGKLLGKTFTPDLRGMFLRGMNVKGGADPNKNRKVGTPQDDALQQHIHDTNAFTLKWKLPGKDLGYTTDGEADAVEGATKNVRQPARTDIETRPKNVAVYFYIKIN